MTSLYVCILILMLALVSYLISAPIQTKEQLTTTEQKPSVAPTKAQEYLQGRGVPHTDGLEKNRHQFSVIDALKNVRPLTSSDSSMR
jgi:hypothetical protein